MENEDLTGSTEVDAFRKAITRTIALESEKLVQEVLGIAYDHDVEAKVRLSAIAILIDRGVPKLGVAHTKEEEGEERGSRRALREDIERMLLGKTEENDER